MLIPIDLPPGLYKNGTPYSAKGHWYDSNLVRFHDGSVRPIGGWIRRSESLAAVSIPSLVANPAVEVVRDALAWRDNTGARKAVFGSNSALYLMNEGGVLQTITPAGVFSGSSEPSVVTGYGSWPFGYGPYGISVATIDAEVNPPQRWAMDNWGEDLLTAQRGIGPIYKYSGGDLVATVVPNAPEDVNDLVVTNERIVMTFGGTGTPRLVQWCDQENREAWTATVSNQAGDQTLVGSGELLRGVNVLKQTLILSETDAHVARYIGPPYVYGFEVVGDNCGPVDANSLVAVDAFAVWIGAKNFWVFDGTVKPLECPVMDYINETANKDMWGKVVAYANNQYNEIWWHYQSTSELEVDRYVYWNYRTNVWMVGALARTAGLGEHILGGVVLVDAAGFIYNHDVAGVLPIGDVFIESGPLELGVGEVNMAIRYVYPDTQLADTVSFTFFASQFPSAEEHTYGPYTYANPMATRVMGRQVRMRINGLTTPFEAGTMRLDVAPVSTGRR